MATYTRKILSGSTDGKGILVVATASSGTTIHTGPASASTKQEVWLYAINTDYYQHTLTIQYGGTTSPNDDIVLVIPAQVGLTLVVSGLMLVGNATPLVIRAYADTASKVVVNGYVNEIV